MITRGHRFRQVQIAAAALLYYVCMRSTPALAQDSVFQTGADAMLDELVTISTPIATIFVMALGLWLLSGRATWGWPMALLLGICVIFGAPQLLLWTRGVFGV
jgi:type IV secretory pathway VirB2 component (pilin)